MSRGLALQENPRRCSSGPEPVLTTLRGIEGFFTYLMNGVEVVICPFDKSHIMLAKRIQYHLRKCVKQHIGEKVVCPYDVTEYVDAKDFVSHLALCTSRSRVEVNAWNSIQNRQNSSRFLVSPPVDRTVPYDIEEYW